MVTFYGYAKCSTCRKAKAYLQKRGVALKEVDITTTPPPKALLQSILASGDYAIAELFNRSGEMYRTLNMKDQMKRLNESALLDLLATHGKLVKRPIVTDGMRATVGYDEARLKTWR